MIDKAITLLAAAIAITLIVIALCQLSGCYQLEAVEKDSNYPYKDSAVWDTEKRSTRIKIWMSVYSGAISRDADERDASIKADNAVKAFDERFNVGFL